MCKGGYPGTIKKGIPHRGVPQNAFVDARQANGAFGARAQGFSIRDCRNKAFGYVSKPVWIHLRYVSMRACVVFGSGCQGVPPYSGAPPPYDYSR